MIYSNQEIRTVEEFADVIGDFSELWELLKNRQVSIYQVHCRDTIIDSNHKRNRHAKGKVVRVDNENYWDVKIKVDFHPDYRLMNCNTGNSQSAKLYTKTQFIFGFQEIYPPLSLQEVKNLKDKLRATKRQIELEFLKNEEIARKINILFEDLESIFEQDFDSSDFFCNLKCSQYISFESYNNKKLDFLKRKKKKELLENLEELLIKYLFIEADELYQSQCKDYINLHEYELKKKPFLTAKKNLLLLELDRILISSFTKADVFYCHELQKYISQDEYDAKKHNFVQSWVEKNLNNNADLEQSLAIGSVNSHVQVIARAGSGKTSTLVNRAIFLQKHCGIKPSEILLLAFNTEAIKEIKKRLKKHSGEDIPYVMTFHSLAYHLVKPSENLVYDETGGQQLKSKHLQAVIHDHLRKDEYYEQIKSLMKQRFKVAWNQIITGEYQLTPEERTALRRTKPQTGIDGRIYKSIGEKIIADFLFEHDLQYIYERNFWWNAGKERVNYRPDFTILKEVNGKKGIVIEYFGLQGDPNYDEQSERKRQYWQNQSNYFFLEINPKMLIKYEGVGIETILQEYFVNIGLRFVRLSEEQIWAKIERKAISRFDKAMTSFIGRCRQQCWTPNQLSEQIAKRDFDPNSEIDNIERKFLHLAEDFYVAYLERLQQMNDEDFDGLMQRSAKAVNEGKTIFLSREFRGDLKKLKYIMIDEYQDFSLLFYNLITAIRNHNQQALFFCVGDSWQAINSFAGADLNFFENFTELFKPSHKLPITTNYRSSQKIVEIGNALMINRGEIAKPYKKEKGEIHLVDIAKFQMTSYEKEVHGFDLTSAVIRLINQLIQQGKTITLLSRNHNLQNAGYVKIKEGKRDLENNIEILEFRKYISKKLNLTEAQQKQLDISTTHSYKGKENQVVIILDIDRYGNSHPDAIFNRIFGDTDSKLFEDERRLLYVALTRAKEELFIITDSYGTSAFMAGLTQRTELEELNWKDYPVPIIGSRLTTIKVSSKEGYGSNPTSSIRELLMSNGYSFSGQFTSWTKFESTKTFANNGSRLQFILQSNWANHANKIEVAFCDEQEEILALYSANNSQWTCDFDRFYTRNETSISNQDTDVYDDFPF